VEGAKGNGSEGVRKLWRRGKRTEEMGKENGNEGAREQWPGKKRTEVKGRGIYGRGEGDNEKRRPASRSVAF